MRVNTIVSFKNSSWVSAILSAVLQGCLPGMETLFQQKDAIPIMWGAGQWALGWNLISPARELDPAESSEELAQVPCGDHQFCSQIFQITLSRHTVRLYSRPLSSQMGPHDSFWSMKCKYKPLLAATFQSWYKFCKLLFSQLRVAVLETRAVPAAHVPQSGEQSF